jgi:fucose permease
MTHDDTPVSRVSPWASGEYALFVVFASMGASTAAIPAAIPSVASSGLGAIDEYLRAVPALFLGLLAGVLLSSALGRVVSPRRVTILGAGIQAAGFAALAFSSVPAAFICMAVIIGVGFGLVEAGGSILARALTGPGTARLLSALTGTVAIVAAAIPMLFAFTPLGRTPQIVFLLVGSVHAVGVGFVLRSRESVPTERTSQPSLTEKTRSSTDAEPSGLLGVLVTMGTALALYVGVETIYSGWSSTIPLLVLAVPPQQAAIGTSIFWLLLASGRYFAAFLLSRSIAPPSYLLVSTSLAAVALGVTALTVSVHPVAATVSLCVAVAALGPCYSLILGAGLSRIPVSRARWATGLLVACGAGGGALIPTIALTVADGPTSMGVFAVTGALTIVSGLLVSMKMRRPAALEAAPAYHP